MTYAVLITPEAEERLLDAFAYIRRDSPDNAGRWLLGAYERINSLSSFPRRCAIAREQAFHPNRELRQLIYHSHRIIFEVQDATSTVRIVYVRHAAEKTVGDPEPEE